MTKYVIYKIGWLAQDDFVQELKYSRSVIQTMVLGVSAYIH